MIEDFEPKEKPPENFYESINTIRKVSNVLNQMVARTYHLGYIEDEKFLRKTLTNLNDLIVTIYHIFRMS